MYGKPIQVQSGRQGFTPSRFHPMRQMGAPLGPMDLTLKPDVMMPGPFDFSGDVSMPAPSPSPSPSPVPGSGGVVQRPSTLVVPSAPQVFVMPSETVALADESDTTKTIITVAAAIGIFALGAAIF